MLMFLRPSGGGLTGIHPDLCQGDLTDMEHLYYTL